MAKNISVLLKKIKNKETIKLNLGVGNRGREGFIGVDINDGPNVDIIYDIAYLKNKLPTNSVDEIYSRHVIEHFPRKELESLLKEWFKLIKRGGKIILDFPDLKRYIDYYIENKSKVSIEELSRWIYGDQTYNENFHKNGFDAEHIKKIIENNNFDVISVKSVPVYIKVDKEYPLYIGSEIIGVKK